MIMIIMALMIIATYTTYDYNDNYYYNKIFIGSHLGNWHSRDGLGGGSREGW